MSYLHFYHQVYLPEHRHRVTITTHVIGTTLGIVWLLASVCLGVFYHWKYGGLVFLFPLVHALPGLIGHRIAERNQNVGDLRIGRKDFPLWWFIRANHRLSWQLLIHRL
jgi:hypothetical protein